GETIALAFKNKDVKTSLHRGKVVYRLEGSSANFEFKDGSRPTIIEFEKDINVPEARKDMTRVWSAKFNPHMKETDPTTFNSVNQMLLITAQNPYYNPPHQVEDHNALAGKVLMAYVFNHEKDGSPAYKIKIDYKSLTAGKSSQELLDENAAQSRDEKGGRPDRASKGEGSSTDEVRPPTMKERLQEMKLKRKK
nr:hypothetical protein [Bacteriovoracaceae bacterium]